jgi:ribosomal protein L37AE/L43A
VAGRGRGGGGPSFHPTPACSTSPSHRNSTGIFHNDGCKCNAKGGSKIVAKNYTNNNKFKKIDENNRE